MCNLNYAPTTLGLRSRREIISGATRTKKVEYHMSRGALTGCACVTECDQVQQ
jgi:hypothetical protein